MRLAAFLIAALFVCSAAQASVTHTNFGGVAATQLNREVTPRDIYGNILDAHAGNITKIGSTFYLIGEAHNCGVLPGTAASHSCGFNVYTSTDLADGHWARLGYLMDFSQAPWQAACRTANGVYDACYLPTAIFNPNTGKYVIWWLQWGTVPIQLGVAVCDTLDPATANCVQQPAPTMQRTSFAMDVKPYMDGTNCYAVYNDNTFEVYIDQLNSSCTDSDGVHSVDTGAVGEGFGFFKNATTGQYYVLWGPSCSYCSAGAEARFRRASTALGTYGTTTVLNANSCNGQIRAVDIISASGSTTYLFQADQWQDSSNQGHSGAYWQPLTFTGNDIDPFSCNNTITIPGLTAGPDPNPWPPTDQGNYSLINAQFKDGCSITNGAWFLQTFVPSVAPLYAVGLPIAQNTDACTAPSPCAALPDGSLEVDLVTVDPSNNPSGTIATKSYPVSVLQWGTQFTLANFQQTLTPSSKYGVVLKPVANTNGCFTFAADEPASSSYPAGLLRVSTNSGSTWSTLTNRSMLFSTFPNAAASYRLGVVH